MRNWFVALCLLAVPFGVSRSTGADAVAVGFAPRVAASEWMPAESPVYCDPDDDWAKDPSVIKDGATYTLFGCIGFSGNGEYYKAYTTQDLARTFEDEGRIKIKNPAFASGTLSHGDIIRQKDEYWFYFQGTRDGGRKFQIGLAKQPVSGAAAPGN